VTPDLRTRYLGLELRSPLVASASPLTGELDGLRRLQDAGAAAAVLPSLFEEQLTHDQVELDRLLETTAEHVGEALSYFPDLSDYNTGPSSYLELIGKAKRAVAIPVIASLNGTTPGGWVRHARRMQDAGADALDVVPRLMLSGSDELRLPLRWIAILYGQVSASLAATSGVHTGMDAAKVLLAGADVAMMTSALLRHGPGHVAEVERQLVAVLEEHDFASVAELRGSMSRRSMPDPAGFERANYVRTLASWSSHSAVVPGQAATRANG